MAAIPHYVIPNLHQEISHLELPTLTGHTPGVHPADKAPHGLPVLVARQGDAQPVAVLLQAHRDQLALQVAETFLLLLIVISRLRLLYQSVASQDGLLNLPARAL